MKSYKVLLLKRENGYFWVYTLQIFDKRTQNNHSQLPKNELVFSTRLGKILHQTTLSGEKEYV